MKFRQRNLFCPACLRPLDLEALDIRDSDGAPTAATVTAAESLDAALRHGLLRSGRYLSCPEGHPLPEGYVDESIPCIAVGLVGPSRSMKTHFLAVITYAALQEDTFGDLGDNYTCSISAPDHTERLLNEEYWPLLETRTALGRTLPNEDAESRVRPPICLRVDWQYGRMNRDNEGSAHLLLFDAPGELIAGTARQQNRVAPYLAAASLVAFFVDLVQVRAIRDQLELQFPSDYSKDNYRTDLVNKCVTMIRVKRDMRHDELVRAPALTILSKADVLDTATGELARMVDPYHGTIDTITADDSADLSARIADRYIPGLSPKLSMGFRQHRMLLASALGTQPASDGTISEIRPFGCEEAFRHILRASGAVG